MLIIYFRDSDVQKNILPGVTHWQSPSYFAYFPSNSSIAGFLGEMLSAAFNIVGFSWITSPAATELETIVLDWLAKLLKLPDDFLSSGSPVDSDVAFDCFLVNNGASSLVIFSFQLNFWSVHFIFIKFSLLSGDLS